jgi:hypothetical protein
METPPKREGACTAPIPNRFNSTRNTPLRARPQVCDPVPLVCANAPIKPPDELWVVTRPVGSSDPIWGEQCTIIGSPERICSMFDLSAGVSWPWRLLKNKKARRFLRDARKEELRYRRDKSAREKAGEN